MSVEPTRPAVLLVDVANVMGSRPDGWWRDREAAATRLLTALASLVGEDVVLPDGAGSVHVDEIRAVVEGQARGAEGPESMTVVRARHDGDQAIVDEAGELHAAGSIPLAVTADRALRRRLPPGTLVAGPGWLNALLGR